MDDEQLYPAWMEATPERESGWGDVDVDVLAMREYRDYCHDTGRFVQ